ncbi:MAG: hypothetical protein MUC57_16415 [Desulfobacterales bacterium]|nr:hypothetical protein [Desulfobacterales bacterium]
MNLEPVSVESPRLAPSRPNVPRELKRTVSAGKDGRVDAKPVATEVLLNQIMIEIALEKIAAQGLCGAEHVQSYLSIVATVDPTRFVRDLRPSWCSCSI